MIKYFVFITFAAALAAKADPVGTCQALKKSSRSCFSEFNGPMEKRCQVCRDGRSCFLALDGLERELCQAYVEGKSCFMALDNSDRGWCEVLKEGKSCFMAFNGKDREACENGDYPSQHLFWAN